MAYPDQPFGFVPIRHKSGAPYNGAANPYWIDSSDTDGDGTYFIGDAVILDSTSNTALIEVPGVGSFPPGTLPGVTKASSGTGNMVTGVITAVAADTRDSLVYRADLTERVVMVCDDPEVVFMGQADGVIPTTAIGRNSNLLRTQEGDTSTGRSGMEIDASDASGATNQMLLLRAVNDPQNEVNTTGNRFEFIWTLHTMLTAGGMVGI